MDPLAPTVAVVGGGLAGIAAAVRLADAGVRPIVIETRKRLGGRATSFEDPRSGQMLDNCQHVLLGCCVNLIDLYDRLGVMEHIDWHRTLYWTRGNGIVSEMKAGMLPAPLHFARSFLRLKCFTFAQKKHIARGMRAMMRLGMHGRVQWIDRTFDAFLQECNQPEDVIRDFWNTVIISACNLPVDQVSAAYGLQVFQEGFLANAWSYTMGLSSEPLVALYDPAADVVRAAGGEIRLGESVRSISYDGQRITGVVTEHGRVEASAVVATVPFDRLDKLISDPLRQADVRLQRLGEIEVSPILGVHLIFEQPIMQVPHLVLVDRPTHWLFNKYDVERHGDLHQHIHAVISGAVDWMGLDEAEITKRVMADVHQVLPGSRGIDPVEVRAVKEKRATFAATPQFERIRPGAAPGTVGVKGGGVENLFLAGDWTDTGWPATMEGAVRSGYLAAEAITGQGGLVDEIPTSWLARRLGLR
jgi:squalene-associated FAD-dependent desaturase